MADSELVCNFRKCRKRLTEYAWVTSCSHIFCDEDGTKQFNKSYKCPACEANLPGKFDIIRVDLQPAEEYKSMVLAGLKPEIIMEICSRAIAFWSYQAYSERVYHEYVSTRAKESKNQLEKYYEQLLAQIQNELSNVKSEMNIKTKELTDTKQRLSEVTEKLSDKGRQLQRLQTMYDSLRRKTVNPAILTEHYGNTEVLNAMKTSFTLPIGTTSGIPKALPNEIDMPQRPVPDATPNSKLLHFIKLTVSVLFTRGCNVGLLKHWVLQAQICSKTKHRSWSFYLKFMVCW
ncbi:E3 ubiquitin-protein ligase CCNB1IP1-like isoform X1 [Rhopilema esculentum]|uniref:E3 ubiquitin-protein ligase CCNB1IP1-like isoform X1 n=1 Tax=Rhopilema esculentum TaxID=499914 RepID=UPI0031DE2E57